MANKFLSKLDAILQEIKTSNQKELLTVCDAAQMFGMSESYLYKLTSQRLIPHFKPYGKTIFFKRSELMQWIENSRVQTRDEQMAAFGQCKLPLKS